MTCSRVKLSSLRTPSTTTTSPCSVTRSMTKRLVGLIFMRSVHHRKRA